MPLPRKRLPPALAAPVLAFAAPAPALAAPARARATALAPIVTALVTMTVALAATGCHSAYIQSTVLNETAQPISLIEVDYPSASFGLQRLDPGQSFPYRFKVLGSGPLKLIYTDASH